MMILSSYAVVVWRMSNEATVCGADCWGECTCANIWPTSRHGK